MQIPVLPSGARAWLPPAVQNRDTTPAAPGRPTVGTTDDWYVTDILGGRDTITVTPASAVAYSAVFACVRIIAQALACCAWNVFQKDGRKRMEVVDDDIAWILETQANPEMSALDWRQVVVSDALLWGNGFAEIQRDGFGRVQWLWHVKADRVKVIRNGAGQLLYEIDNGRDRAATYLRPDEMFHVKGLGPDGLVGWSVVALARRSIELGLSMEQYGQTYFNRGPMPGGILEMPGNVKKEDRDAARKTFERAYGGAQNAGKVIVLSGGMKFTGLPMPNDDAQYLQSRTFGIDEICRWYGVPPHKVAELSHATFSNIEHQSRELVQDAIWPWASRFESEADLKLFGRVNRGRMYTVIDLDNLQRGDMLAQAQAAREMVNASLKTPNEARESFDLNPLEGGDELFIQGAMIPLRQLVTAADAAEEAANNPPEPPEPPEPPSEPPDPTEGGDGEDEPPDPPKDQPPANTADLWKLSHGVISDAIAKLLRVESDKARRAAKQGKLAAWADGFYPTHAGHVADVLAGPFKLFLAALGRAEIRPADWPEGMATRHCVRSRSELAASGAGAVNGWAARAAEQATDEMRRLAEEVSR